jgi:hypothetical protein
MARQLMRHEAIVNGPDIPAPVPLLVGRHRRIRMEDVTAFKARDDRKREAALNELVREAQQLDMGYGRP